MDKLEFIARRLARKDGVHNPDQMAVSHRLQPWTNGKVRLLEEGGVVAPAWKFYVEAAQDVLTLAEHFDANGGE